MSDKKKIKESEKKNDKKVDQNNKKGLFHNSKHVNIFLRERERKRRIYEGWDNLKRSYIHLAI